MGMEVRRQGECGEEEEEGYEHDNTRAHTHRRDDTPERTTKKPPQLQYSRVGTTDTTQLCAIVSRERDGRRRSRSSFCVCVRRGGARKEGVRTTNSNPCTRCTSYAENTTAAEGERRKREEVRKEGTRRRTRTPPAPLRCVPLPLSQPFFIIGVCR